MTLSDCITILTEHNKWRRGEGRYGGEFPSLYNVKELGQAIDYAISTLTAMNTMQDMHETMKPQTFDYRAVKQWAITPNRKPSVLSFTSGIERDVAYLIEDLQQRTISVEDLQAALSKVWGERFEMIIPSYTMDAEISLFTDVLATLGIKVREE